MMMEKIRCVFPLLLLFLMLPAFVRKQHHHHEQCRHVVVVSKAGSRLVVPLKGSLFVVLRAE